MSTPITLYTSNIEACIIIADNLVTFCPPAMYVTVMTLLMFLSDVKLVQMIVVQIGTYHGYCLFRLLTPPGTPLFPSLEMETRKTVMSQLGTSTTRPTSLKSRVSIFNEAFRPCQLFCVNW